MFRELINWILGRKPPKRVLTITTADRRRIEYAPSALSPSHWVPRSARSQKVAEDWSMNLANPLNPMSPMWIGHQHIDPPGTVSSPCDTPSLFDGGSSSSCDSGGCSSGGCE